MPRAKIDDVGFLNALIGEAEAKVGKVPLFITGHSNGSGMAYQLTSKWKSRVRAIGTVSGQLPVELEGKADQPMPSLFICGSEDPISPWKGGSSSSPWGSKESRPVVEMLNLWTKWQGIPGELVEQPKQSDRTVFESAGKEPRAVVRVIRLDGHGHAWPGGTKSIVDRVMGPNTATMDATATILDWFDKYL